jgi:hypothetical protein
MEVSWRKAEREREEVRLERKDARRREGRVERVRVVNDGRAKGVTKNTRYKRESEKQQTPPCRLDSRRLSTACVLSACFHRSKSFLSVFSSLKAYVAYSTLHGADALHCKHPRNDCSHK